MWGKICSCYRSLLSGSHKRETPVCPRPHGVLLMGQQKYHLFSLSKDSTRRPHTKSEKLSQIIARFSSGWCCYVSLWIHSMLHCVPGPQQAAARCLGMTLIFKLMASDVPRLTKTHLSSEKESEFKWAVTPHIFQLYLTLFLFCRAKNKTHFQVQRQKKQNPEYCVQPIIIEFHIMNLRE